MDFLFRFYPFDFEMYFNLLSIMFFIFFPIRSKRNTECLRIVFEHFHSKQIFRERFNKIKNKIIVGIEFFLSVSTYSFLNFFLFSTIKS